VGKSLFRYAPEALPHEILNNCIAIHWPTFAPPRWPTFTPALTAINSATQKLLLIVETVPALKPKNGVAIKKATKNVAIIVIASAGRRSLVAIECSTGETRTSFLWRKRPRRRNAIACSRKPTVNAPHTEIMAATNPCTCVGERCKPRPFKLNAIVVTNPLDASRAGSRRSCLRACASNAPRGS
jgi:hypothetical protein